MHTKIKNALLLLSLLLLVSGCSNLRPSSPLPPSPVAVPAPPAELMEPEDLSGSYSEIVLKLLQNWAKRLTDWKQKS